MLLFRPSVINGQVVVLENIMENNLTIVAYNEIIIVADNVPCSEIEIKTNNGLIKEGNNNCHFILIPTNNSKATIEIYKRTEGQLNFIDKRKFTTKAFQPRIFISINTRFNEITLEELNQTDYVIIYTQGFD